MASQEDRRNFSRSDVVATALVSTASGYAGSFVVDNLSGGGALLSGDPRLRPGDQVKMLLYLAGLSPIRITAQVVRSMSHPISEGDHCIAVSFRQISNWARDQIEQRVRDTAMRLQASSSSVLVVDEEPRICHALEHDLHALGRHSVSVTSNAEALERLEDRSAPIDAALVDLRIGHTEGLELIEALRERYPDVYRVLMSGDVRPCQLDLAVQSGKAHAILCRPWTRSGLAQILSHPL